MTEPLEAGPSGLRCEKCKIDLIGSYERCPLCHGDLTGAAAQSRRPFPVIPLYRRGGRRFIRIMVLASVAACAVCVAVNLSIPSAGWWSLFVLAGTISFWISFAFILRNWGNLPRMIIWQVLLLSAAAILWDLGTGFYFWSLDYVVPILATCAMIVMSVLARIFNLHVRDYIFYLVIDSCFGLLSLILILAGVLNVVVPSAICMAVSAISLAALGLFQGRALHSELQRRIHV